MEPKQSISDVERISDTLENKIHEREEKFNDMMQTTSKRAMEPNLDKTSRAKEGPQREA